MDSLAISHDDRVLILGATGFIGGRLIPELLKENIKLRLLVRTPAKLTSDITDNENIEIVKGDLLTGDGLKEALKGIHTAYYLVHSMGGKSLLRNTDYAEKDKSAVQNFITAGEAAGLKRVIYLGALGEKGEDLSEHLQSRAEVAEIIASKNVSATILRAAIIIGACGASFEMLRYLVERLPVMGCPKWIETRIQPIALRDVLSYLTGCIFKPETAGKTFDICGPEVMSYREMMQNYAKARGLAKRLIFRVPFLTPLLSAYWVDLVTPVPSGVAHPLIEGLKTDVICHNNSINEIISVELTPYEEAVKIAFDEEREGPGVTGW